MSENSSAIEWYLARDGQQHGPLSAAELEKFIELGHLQPTDLLWRAGFEDWRSAADVFPPGSAGHKTAPATPADDADETEADAASETEHDTSATSADQVAADDTEEHAPNAETAAEQSDAAAAAEPAKTVAESATTSGATHSGSATARDATPADIAEQDRPAEGRAERIAAQASRQQAADTAYRPGHERAERRNADAEAASVAADPVVKTQHPSPYLQASRTDVAAAGPTPHHSDPQRISGQEPATVATDPGAFRPSDERADHGPMLVSPSAVTQRPSNANPAEAVAPGASSPQLGAPERLDLAHPAQIQARMAAHAPNPAAVGRGQGIGNHAPLGSAQPQGAANDQSGLHTGPAHIAGSVTSDNLDDDTFYDDEPAERSGWLMVAAALFVFVLLGAGGLLAYNNQEMIGKLYASLAGKSAPRETAVISPRPGTVREAASTTSAPRRQVPARIENVPTQTVTPVRPAAAVTPTPDTAKPAKQGANLPDLPLLKSKLWQFAQQEFAAWTVKHDAALREMASAAKPKAEANKYLIDAFVKFRRDNAAIALLAPPAQLEQIAGAFVANLRALTVKSPSACYAFISSGEATPEIAPFYFDPEVGPLLESQMLTIMQAIVAGRTSPTNNRRAPVGGDFDTLSKELVKRGWTANDLKLFADPNALSKAKPAQVCRLVTDWFATQTKLPDEKVRDKLIAASLRPVIGG